MPTLTGTIKQADGAVRRVDILFTPTWSPKFVAGALVTPTKVQTTTNLTDGSFSVVLIGGEYDAVAGNDRWKVLIPDSGGPHALEDVIQFVD